jgi:hypothetical protein
MEWINYDYDYTVTFLEVTGQIHLFSARTSILLR